MAQANDSIDVTPGTGVQVATQLVGGKEYQVVIETNAYGHLVGDIPTYSAYSGAVTAAANRPFMNIFNASGSGVALKVKKLFIQPSGATVVGVPQTWRVAKTSTAGTGGTTITVRPHETANPALPAQVTVTHSHSGQPTQTFTYFDISLNPEETLAPWGMTAYYSILPTEGDNTTDYVLNPGEGLVLQNVTGLSYSYSALAIFTVQ